MVPHKIKLTLKSAATFGRGDGVAGLVDREIEHDHHGFPYLRGKTLKGLLAESAENIVYALETLQGKSGWSNAKNTLFGTSGRGFNERGILHIGDAQLPEILRAAVIEQGWLKEDVLYSLTGIRRQTAINEHGAPDHATLRSMRVLLSGVVLEAALSFDGDPTSTQLQLLTAAVHDFRRAGTGRNRGRGWLKAELLGDEPAIGELFTAFGKAIQ
jgi:CRISPR/Cas system CSM-associated protein Csm3 (group 7 of RAMP superfamily)